ncbi:MAG: hypothetical protein IT306_28220 [Chloroflexi bacterium]|nr:hypothetical protein [Chloroflexota bacterium]
MTTYFPMTFAELHRRLRELRFGTSTNGTIQIGAQSGTGNFTYTVPPRTGQVTFYVGRQTAGVATSVPFMVVDVCGDWQSTVGGGPGAF